MIQQKATRHTLSDFNYELPKELIAQEPLKERTASRLMVVDRAQGTIEHRRFYDIVDLLTPQDLLVFNNTKVIKARLFAKKVTGGQVDVLFLKKLSDSLWEGLVSGTGKMREGLGFRCRNASFTILEKERRGESSIFKITVDYPGNFSDFLEENGSVPLPPYIKREARAEDTGTYQTVFAKHPGAVAAPTAGLHFTEPLLQEIKRRGVNTVYVTLHVGLGTFNPVKVEELETHQMHEEDYEIDPLAADKINTVRKAGGRIVACGTTSLRTLESALGAEGEIIPARGSTRLFIYPPAKIRSVDALITNFHLPKSTLLMLISAFAGYDLIRKAYQEAISEKYRFFSYGDAMLIL